ASITTGAALKVSASGTSAISAGLVQIAHSGAYTGTGGLLNVTGNSTATGTLVSFSATGLTSGVGLNIAGPTTGSTLTGTVLNISTGSTGAATNGFARLNFSGAHTGNGLQIDDATATGSAVTVNANAVTSGFVGRFLNTGDVAGNNGIEVRSGQNVFSAGSNLVTFTRPDGTVIGTVAQNASTTVAYNNTSDRRLKENITDTHYSLDTVLSLKIHDYNYIADANKTQLTGFIAQELYAQFPDAVTVGSDAVDANGVLIHPWQVDYSKLTPLLAKGIQDLNTKVDSLQAQVASQQLAAAVFNGGIVTGDTQFKAKATFDALASFKGKSVFTGDATFDGNVKFNGDVTFNNDSAGTTTVLAGTKQVNISFSKVLATIPVVTVSPQDFIDGQYKVTHITRSGFSIVTSVNQVSDVQFNWSALQH
ncbi:tail fiber domain-containing protein, partial [Candidatus Saccharibacteria bacterium]|nr:tail fiber domain-containing protein [Candidatus Saccharibacteria bacterium]